MIKGNKGQEGLTLTTLLLIVLGVVVVVVIIMGATGAFDFIFGNVERLPGQSLEAAVQSCKSSASLNLKTDYCIDFKKVEIDGKDQYVTCDYLKESGYLTDADVQNLQNGCADVTRPNGATFCTNQKLGKNDLVNGEDCATAILNAQGGGPQQ